jgi:hypothetical protein
MRMHYSLPQSNTLRVFGGVGWRGSGLGTPEVADSEVWLMARA